MIFLLFFIIGCNAIEREQQAKAKVNKEGKMFLQNIEGHAQKAEIAA